MLFNTPQFVLFFLAVICLWYILPTNLRKILLLITSYIFAYLLGGISTIVVIFLITVLTYFAALSMSKCSNQKGIMIGFIVAAIAVLVYGKYLTYMLSIINSSFNTSLSISVVAMVGVSYYIFSAISYMVDVYKGEEADRSFIDVAVWIAFFAKIIAGPIERHKDFKQQLIRIRERRFDFEPIKRGLLICSLGYFYKIIIADRLSIIVDFVYANLNDYAGITLFVVMILYSLQIYFDFCGYSLIAYGVALTMNIRIASNFNHPYFADSISDFWRRWHISLSSWLKDYLYIPLGGNRRGKLRQKVNIMITFLISGIWHGAGLNYLVWGGLHGLFQIIERALGFRNKVSKSINVIITFLLVSFAWIFFRADSIKTALVFVKRMFCWNPWVITDGTIFNLGLDIYDQRVLIVALIIAFAVEFAQYKNISIYNQLQKHNIVIRWFVYYAIIAAIVVFGKYGVTFDANNFIYFKY